MFPQALGGPYFHYWVVIVRWHLIEVTYLRSHVDRRN